MNLSKFKISHLAVKYELIRPTSELAELQIEEQIFFVSRRFYTYYKIWRQMRTSKVDLDELFVIIEIWRHIILKLSIW